MELKTFDFDQSGCDLAGMTQRGKNWPVVYLIHNKKEMYVGETNSFQNRFRQHLDNHERTSLTTISFVDDEEFNKSAVLDIEQRLIRLCGADQKFKLQNKNAGQSGMHDYYQREKYEKKIPEIWDELSKKGLTKHSYKSVQNLNLFKYSPYTALTDEQNEVCYKVLKEILEALENRKKSTSLIYGSAGTGKTIVAINIAFTLANIRMMNIGVEDDDSDKWNKLIRQWKEYVYKRGAELKIGFVVPMQSLNATLSKVFKNVGGDELGKIVISPYNVADEKYDLLIVDESHRLKRRRALSRDYNKFDESCAKLKVDKYTSNQLEWIIKQSSHCVLFRDPPQTIKPADIPCEEYDRIVDAVGHSDYEIKSQMRCLGGNDYLKYVANIFSCSKDTQKIDSFTNYDIKVFDKIDELIRSIKEKDKSMGLCRILAGFAWEWKTHFKSLKTITEEGLHDIEIEGRKFIWNTTDKNWIMSKNAINEIGCVHTTQGYDLNYVGLIFGNEIEWDEKRNEIKTYPQKFYDKKVKEGLSENPKKIEEFIINAYKVMLVRGIKGCYMYACNPSMKNFLKKWFG